MTAAAEPLGRGKHFGTPWAWTGGLALLWLTVWWRQSALWQGDPEMMFGWAVPLLAVFLAAERWRSSPPERDITVQPARSEGALGPTALLCASLILFPITALFLEAFPTWTAMLWLQTFLAAAITFAVLSQVLGSLAARSFLFPLAFAFVALPWPAAIQQRLIPELTTTLARLGAAILNELGHPAIAHGNLIEVSRTWVGIEEACSGIRSLQCAVMVAFFLGEYLLLSAARRTALFAAGLASAVLANFVRVLFLALQAANGGSTAVALWHDRAGDFTYVLSMGGLGLTAWLLQRRKSESSVSSKEIATGGARCPQCARSTPGPSFNPARPEVALHPQRNAAWPSGLVAAAAVLGAYAWFESNPAAAQLPWTFRAPTSARLYQPMLISADSRTLLRCDRAEGGTWITADGTRRAAYFIHWGRGRSGESLAVMHNPLTCLPAAGARLIGDPASAALSIGPTPAEFHVLDFVQTGAPFSVAYTVAQTGIDPLAKGDRLALRWQAVRHRQRGDEVQLLAVVEWGQADFPPALLAETVTQVAVRIMAK